MIAFKDRRAARLFVAAVAPGLKRALGFAVAMALATMPAPAQALAQTAPAAQAAPAAAVPAAKARLPLVIAAFKDLGSPKEMLGQIVAQALMVGIDDCEHIRPLERAELDKILAEVELGMSGLVDESTAARAGSLIGAKYMVFGAVAQVGAACQVTWRIIHVETGEQLDAGKLRGSKDQLFDLADALAAQIDEAVGSL